MATDEQTYDEQTYDELHRAAQQAVQLVARDFAHQLRGRGQHDLVDELRAVCLAYGFPVHI
jgi:hypothetical protein